MWLRIAITRDAEGRGPSRCLQAVDLEEYIALGIDKGRQRANGVESFGLVAVGLAQGLGDLNQDDLVVLHSH